ncbi:ribosomal protein L7Ae/L30e/S12e/Gadd45 family protein [Artemisia annua]|uniref:Ribosomal protein L7Ae/L30e/S12e/Gadd45 family protein n=1 Tax=Artemisia annua TaxID=35608 RepID=A0A2U1LV96_ARTAN|nr:ribosomal protein L7Ae/L30e/S12e/Gadd45 family protein [Artemisia annua]
MVEICDSCGYLVKVKFATKKETEKVVNPLFEKRPKQFGISRALPPSKDLHRTGSRARVANDNGLNCSRSRDKPEGRLG